MTQDRAKKAKDNFQSYLELPQKSHFELEEELFSNKNDSNNNLWKMGAIAFLSGTLGAIAFLTLLGKLHSRLAIAANNSPVIELPVIQRKSRPSQGSEKAGERDCGHCGEIEIILPSPSQTSQTSQISQIPQTSQISQISQIPQTSQISQIPQTSQTSQISQIPQTSQTSQISQIPQISQISQIPQTSQISQTPSQNSQEASQTYQISEAASQTSQISQAASQTPQTSQISQTPSQISQAASQTSQTSHTSHRTDTPHTPHPSHTTHRSHTPIASLTIEAFVSLARTKVADARTSSRTSDRTKESIAGEENIALRDFWERKYHFPSWEGLGWVFPGLQYPPPTPSREGASRSDSLVLLLPEVSLRDKGTAGQEDKRTRRQEDKNISRDSQRLLEVASREGENSENQQGLELSLQDVVVLALQNNRNLKNAYLDRILQRQDLAVAEDVFAPDFTPELSISYAQNEFGSNRNENGELSLGATVTVRIPTGADIRATWTGRGRSRNNSSEDTLSQNLELSFNQPLLRGFGAEINQAPIEIARVNEKINIISLKSTLIQTITQAIRAYRSLVRAQERLKIQQLSLESEQRQLEVTRALIEAGRQARVDLVQNKAAVASRQVSLLAAENNLDAARLDLLNILDIDRGVDIIAGEIPEAVEPETLEIKEWLELALQNNPAYLQELLRLQIFQFNLLLAQDEERWDFNFNASYTNRRGNTADGSEDWRAGLVFTREFGNLNREQAVRRREIELQQAQNNLSEQRESLEIEVTNRIRDVNFNLKTVEQARRARELSQQQLDNEREKLRLGVGGVRLIDILDFEERLVQAKNDELNAQIDYLNSLTSLEQTIGVTLETWNVTVEH